jgi:hypothetical protein
MARPLAWVGRAGRASTTTSAGRASTTTSAGRASTTTIIALYIENRKSQKIPEMGFFFMPFQNS